MLFACNNVVLVGRRTLGRSLWMLRGVDSVAWEDVVLTDRRTPVDEWGCSGVLILCAWNDLFLFRRRDFT